MSIKNPGRNADEAIESEMEFRKITTRDINLESSAYEWYLKL